MSFVYHGSIYNKKSKGTNELIKKGAKLVDRVDDIVKQYDIFNMIVQEEKRELEEICYEHKSIYNLITKDGISIEDIMKETNKDIKEVNSILTILEIDGKIEKIAGYLYRV